MVLFTLSAHYSLEVKEVTQATVKQDFKVECSQVSNSQFPPFFAENCIYQSFIKRLCSPNSPSARKVTHRAPLFWRRAALSFEDKADSHKGRRGHSWGGEQLRRKLGGRKQKVARSGLKWNLKRLTEQPVRALQDEISSPTPGYSMEPRAQIIELESSSKMNFRGGSVVKKKKKKKKFTYNAGRRRFNSWVGKNPWRRK